MREMIHAHKLLPYDQVDKQHNQLDRISLADNDVWQG